MRSLVSAALVFGLLVGALTAQQPQRAPSREIVNVKGDIYRARNNNYFSLFMVTPDGIILADPINAAFAAWMKEQFAERFKVPVRYVIYSHSHWDHIEGGAVFADTARFIAHENVARNMDGRIPQMPETCWIGITTADSSWRKSSVPSTTMADAVACPPVSSEPRIATAMDR